MKAENLNWHYSQGDVVDSEGRTVAKADRDGPQAYRIGPRTRDRHMELCAMAPALLALAEAVDEHLGLDDLSGFTDEQAQAILLARALVRKAGAI